MDNTNLYRDLRTGTEYIGNWASREGSREFRDETGKRLRSYLGFSSLGSRAEGLGIGCV